MLAPPIKTKIRIKNESIFYQPLMNCLLDGEKISMGIQRVDYTNFDINQIKEMFE